MPSSFAVEPIAERFKNDPVAVAECWAGAETREIASGLNVDFDAAGNVVGIDIDHASRKLDLTSLETVALPVGPARVA